MSDGIMKTWDVVETYDGHVVFRCARQETANYLRDWCAAEEDNRFFNSRKYLEDRGMPTGIIQRMRDGLDQFSVSASEVIL